MHPNPRKTTTVRRLGAVDISAIRDAVLAIPESTWDAENASKPNKFEALDRTRHIVFRFIDSPKDWRKSHDRPAWAEWRERLMPVMEQATRPYGYARGVYPRVMFARMAPGSIAVTGTANLRASGQSAITGSPTSTTHPRRITTRARPMASITCSSPGGKVSSILNRSAFQTV